jgi:hypothetical protein
MTDSSGDAWKAFIRFSKSGGIPDDDRERWDIVTYPPKQKRTRKLRVTLTRAMQQASEAGVAVSSATVNADGSVTLMFGEPADIKKAEKSSSWDEVLKRGTSKGANKVTVVKR